MIDAEEYADFHKSWSGVDRLPTMTPLNDLADELHLQSMEAGWWDFSDPVASAVPTKIALIHSELSEALEAHRRDLADDKLPHRSGLEVELADAVIRILDLAGHLSLDLDGAIAEKTQVNAVRQDHKIENRKKKGGKKY